MDLIVGALVFIGGLIAKPLVDLASEAIRELLARRRRDAEMANVQADKASERCWEALAVLNDNLLVHINRKRADRRGGHPYPERAETSALVGGSAAQLGANVELLPVDARAPLRLVVEILRRADSIDCESNAPFAHYDYAATIVSETLIYGWQVLGSALRREKIPPVPARLREYELALQDEDEFWAEDAADEATKQAQEETRSAWYDQHRGRLKHDG